MPRDLISILDEKYPEVATAFRASIDLMQNDIRVTLVEQALTRHSIEEVMLLLDFDQSYYEPLRRAINEVYAAGGAFALDKIRRAGRTYGIAGAAIGHFDGSNPRAEAWLRDRTSTLITNISDDQRNAIQQALLASWRRGDNPRTTALDIVGRVNQVTRRREGGLLGLTSRQQGWVNDALEELSAGTTRSLRRYLTRELRDKRFDSLILQSIETGRPISDRKIRQILARMKAKTLR